MDLPQSGFEDDDETWLMELNVGEASSPTRASADASNQAEEYGR